MTMTLTVTRATPRPDGRGHSLGRRPFDLIPALILTGILTGFLVLAAFAENVLGWARPWSPSPRRGWPTPMPER